MKNSLYYSVLRYRPSYLLKEQINIGLLFVLPETEEVIFLFPNKLARITQFYAAADLPLLRKYLYALKSKSKKAIGSVEIFDNFIPKDASSLYFSESKQGTYINKEATIDYYKQLYFAPYEDIEIGRKDDAYLKKTFDAKLEAISPHKKLLFKRNVKVKNAVASTKFEFAWQNGQTNFVKTIGLDLSNTSNIQKKAFRWYGELSALNETFTDANIDILVSRPSKKDLFKSYDDALKLLDTMKVSHRIKEENDFDAYIRYATETVITLPKLDFI
jgi:hypothetical protein